MVSFAFCFTDSAPFHNYLGQHLFSHPKLFFWPGSPLLPPLSLACGAQAVVSSMGIRSCLSESQWSPLPSLDRVNPPTHPKTAQLNPPDQPDKLCSLRGGPIPRPSSSQSWLLPKDHCASLQDREAGPGHSGLWPSCPAMLLVRLVTGAFSGYSEDHFALETPAVTSDASVTNAKALSSRGLAISKCPQVSHQRCALSLQPLLSPGRKVSKPGGRCGTQDSGMGTLGCLPW